MDTVDVVDETKALNSASYLVFVGALGVNALRARNLELRQEVAGLKCEVDRLQAREMELFVENAQLREKASTVAIVKDAEGRLRRHLEKKRNKALRGGR